MNTLKTAAIRFSRLAPQGQLRWLKLVLYAVVFLLPFGMAIIALLVYFDRKNRIAATRIPAALPAPAETLPAASDVHSSSAVTPKVATPKVKRAALPNYCGNQA